MVCLTAGIVSAAMEKGPYLIYPGNNDEMMVLWQVSSTETGTLEWGETTSYSSGSVQTSEFGIDHQHEHVITGLTPGVKYCYRVYASGAWHTGSFTAAPADVDLGNVKFMAFGDTRTNPGEFNKVTDDMITAYTSDPDYQTISLLPGDWSERGNESNWTNEFFNRSYSNNLEFQANVPIAGCIGNHEDNGSVYRKYYPYPYVNGHYWSFDYGPVHIAVVDVEESSYTSGSAQYNWLANDLATTTKEWKIVMFHAPAWAGGDHSNNTTAQNNIQPLCVTYGVDLVICGHNHNYVRCLVDGVHHITTGGGGAPLDGVDMGMPYVVTGEGTLNYCKIDIQGCDLTFTAFRVPENTTIESFTITVDTDPPMPDPAEFDSSPASASTTSISMTATTATDVSPVEYYFKNITIPGHDSGWQSSSAYTDTALTTGQVYGYKVRCSDLSSNYNMTGFSAPEFSMAGSVGSTVTVPDIAGYDPNTAKKVIIASGLTVGAFDSAHSEVFAIGRISSQSPVSGLTADSGDPVDFTVSLGLLADHDDDDMVGLSDLVIAASGWLDTTDLTDFAQLSSQWLDTIVHPVAYWPLDTDARDDTLNGWHGTPYGDAYFTTDPTRGDCLLLDGDGDYINVGFILDPADGPFSVCAWVKDGTDKDNIMCQTDGTGAGTIWLFTDSNGHLSTMVGGGLFSTYSGHTDGDWHHVAMVYDGNRRYLYADGQTVASDSSDLSGSLETCDGILYIGAHQTLSPDAFWYGLIDNVRLYNKSMSSSEIFALYNSEVLP